MKRKINGAWLGKVWRLKELKDLLAPGPLAFRVWRLTRRGFIEVFGGCPPVAYDR